MRLGLDLRHVADRDVRLALATEADRWGLWAVVVGGTPGTETVDAAAIAVATENVHVIVAVDVDAAHPTTVAEEIAVLDHLSARRAAVIAHGDLAAAETVRRLLAGELVDGFVLAPPPAQTAVAVWTPDQLPHVTLNGDVAADAAVTDRHRDAGTTHLLVTWPGSVKALARHLASRAAASDFPQVVADMADRIDPPG